MTKKMSHKTQSLFFLCLVAVAALIAVAIVEYQANKTQINNSPALSISRIRAKTTPTTPKSKTAPKTTPINPTVKTTQPK